MKKIAGAVSASAIAFTLVAGVTFAQTMSPSPTQMQNQNQMQNTTPQGAPNTGMAK